MPLDQDTQGIEPKGAEPFVALIGDVVKSRSFADRQGFLSTLERAIEDVNLRALNSPVELTIGDEFQATFLTPEDAVLTSNRLRLALLAGDPPIDTRFGIGVGDLSSLTTKSGPHPEGTAWWAARDAVNYVHDQSTKPRFSFLRTWLIEWEHERVGETRVNAINAYFVVRDAIMSRMRPKDVRVFWLWMNHESQEEIARLEGVTQSAISRVLTRSGAYALRAAERALVEGAL